MKRYIRWFLAIGAVCITALAVLWALSRGPIAVDKETCERVQPGMTLAEVEAILGGPPGNYTGVFIRREMDVGISLVGSASKEKWTGRGGMLQVFFDAQGKVIAKQHTSWPDE